MLQSLGLLQACRKSYAAHRAILLIGAPSGSSNVASHNALDWKDFETFDHHTPAPDFGDNFRGHAFLESLRDIHGDVVSAKRGNSGLEQFEPELAELGENGALLVDTLVVPK